MEVLKPRWGLAVPDSHLYGQALKVLLQTDLPAKSKQVLKNYLSHAKNLEDKTSDNKLGASDLLGCLRA